MWVNEAAQCCSAQTSRAVMGLEKGGTPKLGHAGSHPQLCFVSVLPPAPQSHKNLPDRDPSKALLPASPTKERAPGLR